MSTTSSSGQSIPVQSGEPSAVKRKGWDKSYLRPSANASSKKAPPSPTKYSSRKEAFRAALFAEEESERTAQSKYLSDFVTFKGLAPKCEKARQLWASILSQDGDGNEPTEDLKRARLNEITDAQWRELEGPEDNEDEDTPPPSRVRRTVTSSTPATSTGNSSDSNATSGDERRGFWKNSSAAGSTDSTGSSRTPTLTINSTSPSMISTAA